MGPPKGASEKGSTPRTMNISQPDQARPRQQYHHHPYQTMAFPHPGLLQSGPYFKPADPHQQFAALYDLAAVPDSSPFLVRFPLDAAATSSAANNTGSVLGPSPPPDGDTVVDEWTWAISDNSAASLMPSLDGGSTISNVSTRSGEAQGMVMSQAAMMPPARPYPPTRASSLDFGSSTHNHHQTSMPPCPGLSFSLDLGDHDRFQSPAVLSELSDVSTFRSPCPSPTRARLAGAQATTGSRSGGGGSDSSSSSKRNMCSWAGCGSLCFLSHEELVWHVKAEHLLVCPAPGCVETTFASARHVYTHLPVAHPELGLSDIKDWVLDSKKVSPPPAITIDDDDDDVIEVVDLEKTPTRELKKESTAPPENSQAKTEAATGAKTPVRNVSVPVEDTMTKELLSVATCKRKCQEQLRNAVEKRAKKRPNASLDLYASSPYSSFTSAPSPTDLVRGRAMNLIETASFPLVYEHTVLPFLAEFLPRWTSPKHVISVIRGKTRDSRRICILTETDISFARKIIIARHVRDLLPENHRPNISFVFSMGEVIRTQQHQQQAWARGLNRDQLDDICATRNPYYYRSPCMGDSIGIPEQGSVDEATATLGPCLNFGGGSFWLSNFHPFLDAYKSLDTIRVEHPSPQDRAPCLEVAHDALSPDVSYVLGDVAVTSGLTLYTTRVSHEPYWEECGKDQPLVVTDWALITASSSRANMLRRFPSERQPTRREPLIRSASAIMPGASVCSSGRTSGFQRGQVCEIPAYVSGVANGTGKATREWFVEEPYNCDDEDAWIRGGIGVSGDSGAAVVDADTSCLIGQVWGRNRYWGPGPRQAFFTPMSDIFDDIQEKCGQQDRPQLPQFRDEADTYATLPTCQRCYDLQVYYDSRRSSRVSLQSMIMGRVDGDQDLTSIEAVSELATPRDLNGGGVIGVSSARAMGLEETGSAFNNIFSPSQLGANTPIPSDAKSPYAPMLIIDDDQSPEATSAHAVSRKRSAQLPLYATDETKRPRMDGEM